MFSLDNLLTSLILLMSFVVVLFYPAENHIEFSTSITFVINAFIWLALLVYEGNKRRFSLVYMHLLFCYVFFYVVAFIQYKSDRYPWGRFFENDVIFCTNIILLIWTLFFCLGYGYQCMFGRLKEQRNIGEYNFNKKKATVCLIISLALIAFRFYDLGFLAVFTRSESNSVGVITGGLAGPIYTLFSFMSIYTVFFTMLYCWFGYRNGDKFAKRMFIIAILTLLIGYPPTGIPRFLVAVIYGGFFLIISHSFKKCFKLIFTSLFLFVFPLLDVFRNGTVDDAIMEMGNVLRNLFSWNYFDIFYLGHYDAYTILCDIYNYVSIEGITWGRQLLGVVLFFVPRALWGDKPTGTGNFIANQLNYPFDNVSCALPGEVYINFGIIGIVFVAYFVGYLLSYIDNFFWNFYTKDKIHTGVGVIYPCLIFFVFFVSRGDLMSSVAFIVSFVVAYKMIYIGRSC